MRRTILLAGVLLSVVALGSDSQKEYDDKTTVDPLEGTWRLIGSEFEGKKMDIPVEFAMWTFRRGTYTIDDGDGNPVQRGTYRIDATQKPAHLDMGTAKFIYQIDGDTLRHATLAGAYDTPRPQGFYDKAIVVRTYKRVK